MTKSKPRNRRRKPKASRPHMPGYGILDRNSGRGLLPWNWATERLAKTRNYLLATARPDARPHVMPVWGVWLDDKFYFSTGRQSRKARNLAANPNCVISVEKDDESIIVEGVVCELNDPVLAKRFAYAYGPKYQWDMGEFKEPLYEVRPRVVFALISRPDEFSGSATRWVFDD